MSSILSYKIATGPIIALVIGGFPITYYKFQPWNYVLWALAALWLMTSIIYNVEKRKKIENNEKYQADIKVADIYEDNKRECGLIINNTGKNPVKNCRARLIDLTFEIPNPRYSLERYPRSENLICTKDIPEYGDGKIPLFRWGWDMASKDLEIVYENDTIQIGYGILNVPILVLLNIWADKVHAIYVICRLSDRLGWGYALSILKTGTNREQLKLANYQK